jgi:hypothetical protein
MDLSTQTEMKKQAQWYKNLTAYPRS